MQKYKKIYHRAIGTLLNYHRFPVGKWIPVKKGHPVFEGRLLVQEEKSVNGVVITDLDGNHDELLERLARILSNAHELNYRLQGSKLIVFKEI